MWLRFPSNGSAADGGHSRLHSHRTTRGSDATVVHCPVADARRVHVAKACLLALLTSVPELRQERETLADKLKTDLQRVWRVREDLFARSRLAALKESDTDAYMQLVSSTKISSLLGIMERTHSFMTRIGAQLGRLGNPSAAAAAHPATTPHSSTSASSHTPNASDEYRRFQEYVASTKDEYKLVHRRNVFVAEQPAGVTATLMPHQMVGLRFLASLHANGINGILADEMGVGKTLQTLSFLVYLKETLKVAQPSLVLAPLSIVREWCDAAATFTPTLRVAVFDDLVRAATEAIGDAGARSGNTTTVAARIAESVKQCDVVMLAVHRVRAMSSHMDHLSWYFVVVDEAHKAVSNSETLTAVAINRLNAAHRLVLTGTPLNSDIQELWSLLNFINPGVFDERESFEEVFRKPFSSCGWSGGGGAGSVDAEVEAAARLNEEERALLVMRMHQILRPFMLRRTIQDVDASLRITHHTVVCPLSVVQTHLLAVLRSKGALPGMPSGSGASRCSAPAYGYCVTKERSAQQICNSPMMIPFFSQVFLRAEGKPLSGASDEGTALSEAAGRFAVQSSGKFVVLDLLLRRLRAVGRKCVVFSHWLDSLDLLVEYLEWRGWGEQYVLLNGTSTSEERREGVHRFRTDPNMLIVALSVKAGGCGLNLQVADVVILLDQDYTATNDDQAIARVFRMGQRNTVRAIYLLTADESEARVSAVADRKNRPRLAIIEAAGYHTEATETATSEQERLQHLADVTGGTGGTGVRNVIDLTFLAQSTDEETVPNASANATCPAAHAGSDVVDAGNDIGRNGAQAQADAAGCHSATSTPKTASDVAHSFDELLCGEDAGRLERLRREPAVFEPLIRSPPEMPDCVRTALEACEDEERRALTECGKGKRARNEDATLFEDPPEAYFDRCLRAGLDPPEIFARFREEERLKASLAGGVSTATFLPVSSVEVVRLHPLRLTRKGTVHLAFPGKEWRVASPLVARAGTQQQRADTNPKGKALNTPKIAAKGKGKRPREEAELLVGVSFRGETVTEVPLGRRRDDAAFPGLPEDAALSFGASFGDETLEEVSLVRPRGATAFLGW